MMPLNMLNGEVHVQILDLMQRTDSLVQPTVFVEQFVTNQKAGG